MFSYFAIKQHRISDIVTFICLSGKHLFNITAVDDDSSTVTFRATNDETSKLVEVESATRNGNKWTATVSLKEALDRDRVHELD